MAIVYFPSCRFKEFLPEISSRIEAYMRERYDAVIEDCCRPRHQLLTSFDTAVTICNTCQAIVSEDSPARVKSLWELIAEDPSLPLPSLGGRMALQDCWRSRGCHEQQNAVREVLARMGVHVVELPDNRDDSSFCGTTLLSSLPAENARFAPKRFIENGTGLFIPKNQTEQREAMRRYCGGIAEDRVVCYCVPCTKGIRLGGKQAFHIAELAFGGKEFD